MTDIHSREIRSYNMSRIKGKDTKPEMLVRRFLFAQGFRYRLHDKKLPGKPDIILPKYKSVIFIHGCFWHGHEGCKYYSIPKTRSEWWKEKISKNVANDEKAIKSLQENEWRVIVIWGCDLKPQKKEACLSEIKSLLLSIPQPG